MHRNDFLPRYRISFLVSQIESNEDRYNHVEKVIRI